MNVDLVRGAILCGAVGDALASAHEGRAPGPVGSLGLGAISDDTQLTLASAEAVVEARGAPTPEQLAASLLAWHRERGYSGLGAATAKAIRELSVGGHWALVGRKGEMAAGNGPAVRVAPLALVLDLDDRLERRALRDLCRITHHSDEAYVGALAIGLTLRDAWLGPRSDRESLFARLTETLPDTAVRDRLDEIGATPSSSIAEVAARFGASGYVVESVPLAIHACFASATDGFVDTVTEIVEAGGDCDSIAAMAGQCLGARHGASSSVLELARQLPTVVGEVTDRLCQLVS